MLAVRWVGYLGEQVVKNIFLTGSKRSTSEQYSSNDFERVQTAELGQRYP